jgi:transposase InsO family protein
VPWKVHPVSDVRFAFLYQIQELHKPIAQVCREFGISRKTAYKWIGRSRSEPQEPLKDRSRRPRSGPRNKTSSELEQEILAVRARYGWGARKIRAYLMQEKELQLPSINTVQNILHRHGVLQREAPPKPIQTYERSSPNQLWQIDFKGPLEVERRRVCPLSILDDHSRFLLKVQVGPDLTMNTAWKFLWETFGEYGLPDAVLCDNAFSNRAQNDVGISRFDSWLVRLRIRPIHGRPYHPQTQGKVERLHRTYEDEMLRHVRRDTVQNFNLDADRWRREIYNTLRPHEALGDHPPISRFQPSLRRRPDTLPAPEYLSGAVLRKVSCRGEVSYKSYRILVGKGLDGETVEIREQEDGWSILYAEHRIRLLAPENLKLNTVL